MSETVRQIISIVSHMIIIIAISSIAIASYDAKGIPRIYKAFAGAVALGMSVLCFHSLVADPRFGISLVWAYYAVTVPNVIAMFVAIFATRNHSPAVN